MSHMMETERSRKRRGMSEIVREFVGRVEVSGKVKEITTFFTGAGCSHQCNRERVGGIIGSKSVQRNQRRKALLEPHGYTSNLKKAREI